MDIPEKLTKAEARAWLCAIDADPNAIDWGNVRAALASVEAEVAAWPELLRGLPVEKTLAILRAHVAYLDAPDETAVRDVTHIATPPDKPTTGVDARAALLDAAHAALAALKSFETVMVEHEDADIGEGLAHPLIAIRARLEGTADFMADRLPPVERTREVVLRAMLRAYEAAALDAQEAFARGQTTDRRMALFDLCASELRSALVWLRARGNPVILGGCEVMLVTNDGDEWISLTSLAADYEARLRGDRPLDAPPMEV